MKEYKTIEDARRGLDAYFSFYNHTRPHQALDYLTPAVVHVSEIENKKALARPVDMMDNRGTKTGCGP